MTIEAYPLDTAQVVTEVQWQRMARIFAAVDGVDSLPTGSGLKVVGTSGLGYKVLEGMAILRGFFYKQTGDFALSSPGNNSSSPRVDKVVLRANLSTNSITPFVIVGTAATKPAAPNISYSETVFDLPLANVRVEANDTILAGSVVDQRRFVGRPMVYCTSTNRPDPQGRPLLAFELDTNRVIYSSGDGSWAIGLGDDFFRPQYVFSEDGGHSSNISSWDATLGSTSDDGISISFVAPPSGKVAISHGAYMSNNTAGAFTYQAVRLLSSTGSVVWNVNDVAPVGGDIANRFIKLRQPKGSIEPSSVTNGKTTIPTRWNLVDAIGASCASTYLVTLSPGVRYTARLFFRVSAGTGSWDDRFLKIDPLP